MEIDPGIKRYIEEMAKQRGERATALEALPYECQKISRFEISKLHQVRETLNMLIQAFEKQMIERHLTDAEKQEYFEQVLKHLDQYDLWDSKFTSADQDEQNENNHSVYYTTSSGVSLRLKRINLLGEGGLRHAVQPFMEKIYFETQEPRQLFEEPVIGATVEELVSDEFLDLLASGRTDNDFQSAIKIYRQDGKLVAVDGARDIKKHLGHEVRRIFFDKKR